ncbi:MAG: chemotaxis-specific protein-glutamate methyltransferase CheB [Alcanivoracaceae bacterium]|nr:chemotaxis-specific protein-glutamate methyltransferase CheB [Alcanivoracaceae bacterium]
MIKVLVVDDSGFMRLALRKMLANDPAITVVGEATNGNDAVRLAQMHRPDVITMDVEMPDGDGLAATRDIMERCPTAIIMVSSLTQRAAETTLKALDLGAVDYIPKASSFVSLDIVAIEKELIQKVRYWALKRPVMPLRRLSEKHASERALPVVGGDLSRLRPPGQPDMIVIGASTGGPKILPELLAGVEPLACPVVIALHMPPVYTRSFAEHVASATGHLAMEGYDGMALKPGMVVVAPGGTDSEVHASIDDRFVLRVRLQEKYGIHPSVDALFHSVAKNVRSAAGVILTGMGSDGTDGALAMSLRKFPVLCQDETSSLVFGMPRAAAEAGAASALMSVPGIAQKLNAWAGLGRSASAAKNRESHHER